MFDFKKTEEEILKFWEKKKIYERVKKKNSSGKKFYFLQGPPYTSGKIHIGHAWNNAMKDMVMRYKRMKGFDVWDRGGYDMHGLPTEHAVQKKLKLKTKEDIVKYGVEKFVKACLDFSNEHARYMNEDFWKLGVWMDHESAYKPVEKEFIDGEWLLFKKAWEQGRLYRGLKSMHWDSETETSLAKHELEYKSVKDKSVFLKFRKEGTSNEYFIIWTTTPWTIPFNLAIMVNPNLDYVKVKVDDEYWILADVLAGIFVSGLLGKKVQVVDKFKGKELEAQSYVHPLHKELGETYAELKKQSKNVHTVVLSEKYVDTSAGSGLVHCAPGCGPEDNEVGNEYGIPPLNTLNERGEFENMGKYTGWIARTDDEKFISEFEKKKCLIVTTEVEHEYPHSDRSKKPVVFRLVDQWFMKTEDIVPKLLDMNKKVRWVPKSSGERYAKWTENLRDNSITRQRFWGCPIPIWINEKNENDFFVVGSVAELEKLTGKKFDDLSLHKPWIDKVIITKGSKKYRRIPDVADVWLDSGTVSWNCLYNDPKLIKKYFPADFILEANEQARLWFSMLQICSHIVLGKPAYENVYTTGMIFDFEGVKMSKSLGNIVSPYEVIDKYSADILRYYLSGISAGQNINFSWEDVKVRQRNLIMLTNIANYILDLEMQKPEKGKAEIEEKWIISKYHSTLKRVTELFEEYRLDEVINEVEGLYIKLSRDYIKFVRDKASNNSAVLETVKEIYLGILKMFAPVCPFITESLWQKLSQKEESIHLAEWPEFNEKKINKKLEASFDSALQIIERGLAERDKVGIGLKWPLSKAIVRVTENIDPANNLKEIIERQLNVKNVEIKLDNEFAVEYDTKLTPELEAEGFARELSRRVQAERKKLGMKKGDLISLKIMVDSNVKKMFEKHLNFLKERTNSKKIEFVDDLSNKNSVSFDIKGKKIDILIS